MGKLWIGIMPNERINVIGLLKYARLAEWVMGRLRACGSFAKLHATFRGRGHSMFAVRQASA